MTNRTGSVLSGLTRSGSPTLILTILVDIPVKHIRACRANFHARGLVSVPRVVIPAGYLLLLALSSAPIISVAKIINRICRHYTCRMPFCQIGQDQVVGVMRVTTRGADQPTKVRSQGPAGTLALVITEMN